MNMLVNRSSVVAINDVVTLKLVTGEEIVGKLLDQKIDSVTLGKPIQITLQPVGPKQVGLAFSPVLGSVAEAASLTIPVSAMAIKPVMTGEDVARNYRQATSNVATPTPHELASIIAP